MPIAKREKNILYIANSTQDKGLPRNVPNPNSDKEPELEIEHSKVTMILPKCCEFNNQIKMLSEAYHLVHGGHKNLFYINFLLFSKN
jgi:hypothetical protein